MNPIEAAVMPLKTEAVERARLEAEKLVQRYRDKLTECGMDREKAFPYPSGINLGRNDYLLKLAQYNVCRKLTKGFKSSRHLNEPDPCEMSAKGIERFIKQAKEDAAAQYDLFVAKLVRKIGACDSAVLTGSHVWGYSVLHVTKGETKENWKTQQIVNCSKLGLLFNQWPSRKMK